jgi:hypothetical protein
VKHDQANTTENMSKGKSSGKANRANGANAGANYDSNRLKDCPRSGKPLKTNKPGISLRGDLSFATFSLNFSSLSEQVWVEQASSGVSISVVYGVCIF